MKNKTMLAIAKKIAQNIKNAYIVKQHARQNDIKNYHGNIQRQNELHQKVDALNKAFMESHKRNRTIGTHKY